MPATRRRGVDQLGEVAAQGPDEAEVEAQREPPHRMPSVGLRQSAAQVAEQADGGEVDRDHEVRDRRRPPEAGEDPDQERVGDALDPERDVDRDAAAVAGEVPGGEGEPVGELPVEAVVVADVDPPVGPTTWPCRRR